MRNIAKVCPGGGALSHGFIRECSPSEANWTRDIPADNVWRTQRGAAPQRVVVRPQARHWRVGSRLWASSDPAWT